jgi:ribosomal protein L7/L12
MNHYSRAIELIARDDIDWKVVAIDYAKKHPKSFALVAGPLVSKAASFSVEYKVRQTVADSGGYPAGKIKGIRIYRELTGASLMDAKTYVEKLYE